MPAISIAISLKKCPVLERCSEMKLSKRPRQKGMHSDKIDCRLMNIMDCIAESCLAFKNQSIGASCDAWKSEHKNTHLQRL